MINAVINRSDAFTEFKWNPKAQRYTVRSGAGKSQFISEQAFFNRLSDYIRSQQQSLVGLADRLSSGGINLEQFQREASRILVDLHTSQLILARGGPQKIDRADLERVGAEVKRQLYAGRDGDRRYGVRWLTKDLIDGKVSAAQLRQRLEMYSRSGIVSYWEGAKATARDEGKLYAQRILGGGEHCKDCPVLAAQPPKPIDQVPAPTRMCECRMMCNCSLVFLSVEEAVQRGMKDPRPKEKRKKELEAIERLARVRR